MVLGIVMLGLLHGLVFLPVYLAGKLEFVSHPWVCCLMVVSVGYEFRDRGSIPSVCQSQITDDDLGKFVYFVP